VVCWGRKGLYCHVLEQIGESCPAVLLAGWLERPGPWKPD